MLLSLTLADFVLVDRLSLDFHNGFSVLTGETGAGKSILLDALALALGERADSSVVRAGAERAEISAEFDPRGRDDLALWLTQQALAAEDGQLLLRRVIDVGGRSRAFINGRPATAQQLKEVGALLVDIHGQHAHYSLLKAAEQRRLLDSFAGAGELAAQVGAAWNDWRAARIRRERAQSQSSEFAAERERLLAMTTELTGLAFSPDAWLPLQEEQRRLAHAAELQQGAQLAAEALDGDDAGLLTQLRVIRARLADLAEIDPQLEALHTRLEGVAEELHDTARELHRYGERVELDPEALMQAEARLSAIQAAARKYHVRPEGLPAALAEALQALAALGEHTDLDALQAEEQAMAAAYQRLGEALSARRGEAAVRLRDAVTRTMQQLAMQGGCFNVALETGDAAAHGLEDVVFQVSPHAGQGLQALAKTASGGELSRIGLALQTVLSAVSGAPTLLFDEVDAGIGGGVAEIVGRLLAGQGKNRQVLCVTHLPQVAARAAWHYHVSKHETGGGARSAVRLLSQPERVAEIARMLGGVQITAATRQHAQEMLEAE